MVRCGFRGKRLFAVLVLAVLLAGGAVAWAERAALLSWYYVRGLATAGAADRERWVERVAGLGEAAVPDLLACLARDDDACRNAGAALVRLSAQWGGDDSHTAQLALQLAHAFPRLAPAGRQVVLEVASGWFVPRADRPTPSPRLASACTRLVAAAASAEPAVQAAGLELCVRLLARPQAAEALVAGRDLVAAGLQAPSPASRVRAVSLALYPGMDLLEQVVPLLEDTVPEVRRAAMLAVGPADKVIRDEGLLPYLHDPDAEVRRLCAAALRGRGLRPEHLELGRLLTDPRPAVRLKVLDYLGRAQDLDPALWLRRLSHDPSPAVRAAALRVMSQQGLADLGDRIDQMARSDPSPTVCQLARYYRTCLQPTRPAGMNR